MESSGRGLTTLSDFLFCDFRDYVLSRDYKSNRVIIRECGSGEIKGLRTLRVDERAQYTPLPCDFALASP